MCWEDVELARKKQSNAYTTTTSITLNANPDRLSVIVSAQTGDMATLRAQMTLSGGAGGDGPILAVHDNDNGGAIAPVNPVGHVTLDMVGDCLCGPLILLSKNGAGVFAVESYLRKRRKDDGGS